MSENQFKKRQKKIAAVVEEAKANSEALAVPVKEKDLNVNRYTQVGMDVYTADGGRSYNVAEIEYNPDSKEARVKEVFSISRLVALSYAEQKTALKTLKRKK